MKRIIRIIMALCMMSLMSDARCASRQFLEDLSLSEYSEQARTWRKQVQVAHKRHKKLCEECITISCGSDSESQGCEPTVIVDTGEPLTLTEPGTYCMGSDFSHIIFIEGSNITLDMNGHVIFISEADLAALAIRNNVSNVRVHGGFIVGQAPSSLVVGIAVLDAFETRIHDVTVENCRFGIILVGDNDPEMPVNDQPPVNTRIESVITRNNVIGIFCINDINTVIANSICAHNENGIGSQPSINSRVESCVAQGNTNVGFGIDLNHDSVIINCLANENGAEGFRISNSVDCILRDCVASNNGLAGFGISLAGANISFFNCVALHNDEDGFLLEVDSASYFGCTASYNGRDTARDGFRIFSDVTALVRDCTAENNGGYGFNNNNLANQFYANVACLNGLGNYFNVDPALISSPANVRGVHNVDCDDATPDQVDVILTTLEGQVCDVTFVTDVVGGQTISAPGRYCLVQDLFNVISIDGNGIVLDLNSHTIHVPTGQIGVNINPSISNVVVSNGFINGDGVGNYGLNVSGGATDIRLENLVFESCVVNGVQINDNTERIFVSSVQSNNHGTNGIFCGDSLDVVITDTTCVSNGFGGAQCINTKNLSVQRCSLSGNENVGIYLDSVERADIVDSLFDNNTLNGLQCLNNAANIVVRSCIASGNEQGFFAMSTASNIAWLNSVAFNNVGAGFAAVDSSSVMMRECVANNNSIGFNNSSAGSVLLYATSACFNTGLNYAGSIAASVVGASTAQHWQNVDCNV